MSTRVEDLAAQALQLPVEDRAELVERLMASFEPGLVAKTGRRFRQSSCVQCFGRRSASGKQAMRMRG